MITPDENYEQDKITGKNKQTVILDETETAETDELDPKFHEDQSDVPNADPENLDENADLKGEKIYNEPAEPKLQPTAHDSDLNHNSEDDLSLNKPEDDIF